MSQRSRCLSEEAVAAWVRGELPGAELATARKHASECDACFAWVAHANALADPARTVAPAPPASILGERYEVLEEVGRGAMGVVFRVYDRTLERNIAVKLLRPRENLSVDGDLGQHVLRESKAMARLRHPHVVTVHDVVVRARASFIAMEYVPGTTLRKWLETKPSRGQILAMFRAIAEGLTAAHEAGLVHRDFKPENVLVDSDRRPKIVDFGLSLASSATALPSDDDGDVDLSATAIGGTPAYMPPEQFDGGNLDRRADVFAYCVALWEALTGTRPFPEDSVETRFEAARKDRVAPPPPGSIPVGLEAALRRGLAADPRDRPTSVRAILETADRQRRSLRRGAVALAVTATGLAAAWASTYASAPLGPADVEAEIAVCVEDAWGTHRTLVERIENPDAPTSVSNSFAQAQALSRMRNYMTRLETAHQTACRSAAYDEISADELRLRQTCLRLKVGQVVASLDEATPGDPSPLGIANQLPEVALCAAWGREALRGGYMAPMNERQLQLLDTLSRLDALSGLQRVTEAEIEAILHDARQAGHPWLEARITSVLASVIKDADWTRSAELSADLATRFHRLGDHVSEAAELVQVEAHAALTHGPLAREQHGARRRAALAEVTEPALTKRSEAYVVVMDASLALQQGDLDRAEELVVDLNESRVDRMPAFIATTAILTSALNMMRGDVPGVIQAQRELAVYYEAQGGFARHEHLTTLGFLHETLLIVGKIAEARIVWTKLQALALDTSLSDRERWSLVLGESWLELHEGKFDSASRRVQASVVEAVSDDELRDDFAVLRGELALVQGDPVGAVALLQGFTTPPDLETEGLVDDIDGFIVLARAYRRAGRADDAHRVLSTIAEVATQNYPQLPYTAFANLTMGFVLLDRGEPALAEASFERALPSLPDAPNRAWCRFGLDLARAEGQTTSASMRQAARDVAEVLERWPRFGFELGVVTTWLEQHPGNSSPGK